MRIDPLLCQEILILVEGDEKAGSGQFIRVSVDGYDQKTIAHHVKYLWDEKLVTGQEVTHMQSPFPEILMQDITPKGRKWLDEREPERDAIKLEERNWHNWLAVAEKTRDEKLKELAAKSAKDGVYYSGGRLKEDMKIIFASIDEVVTKAVAMRRALAAEIPALASSGRLAALRSRAADFINSGVSQVDDQMSKTTPDFPEGARRAIQVLAHREIAIRLDHVNNDLDGIGLESKLNSKREERNQITIHVSGNSNNVNLGSVLGDLNTSVQTLNQGNQKDVAEAIQKLGEAIQSSDELDDDIRREYLEHLATVSEQVAKPPERRRITTFTNAIGNLASIASVALKIAPVYHQFITLLADHHILDK